MPLVNPSIFPVTQVPRRMEGRLFGRTEAEKRRREELKAKVLLACERERLELKHCIHKSVLGWCTKEQKDFWDCFTKVNAGTGHIK